MNEKQKSAIEILAELSGKRPEEIVPEMELVADLNIDSPKALQLLVEIEERIGIEISDEDAAKLDTVDDVLGYLGGLA